MPIKSAVIAASTRGQLSGDAAIALMTVIFVLYGVAGGLGAAIITDFIQGVLTIVFSFLLLPLIMNAVGGMDGIRAGKTQAKAPHQQFLARQIAAPLPGPGDDQERSPEYGRQPKPHQVVLHRARATGELAQQLQKEIENPAHLAPLGLTSVDRPVRAAQAPVCSNSKGTRANHLR